MSERRQERNRRFDALANTPFLPLMIPTLWLWLPPDQSGSFTTVSGKISQWNDYSGLGHNVTQGTAANRPTLSTDANGRTYSSSAAGTAIVLTTAATFPGTPYTYFIVCFTSAQVATLQGLLDAGTGGSPSDSVFIAGNSLTLEQSNNGGVTAITGTVTAATNLIISASSDGSNNGTLFISPNSTTTGALGTQSPQGVFNIGNLNTLSDSWGGGIYEVIIYSSLLSASQQAQVRAYLGSKYNIPTK